MPSNAQGESISKLTDDKKKAFSRQSRSSAAPSTDSVAKVPALKLKKAITNQGLQPNRNRAKALSV